MECLLCGDDDVSRLVIDKYSQCQHRGLCDDCDRAVFGVISAEPLWHRPRGCGLCGEQPRFALPEIEYILRKGETVSELEYEITIETLELCLDHALSILGVNPNPDQQATVPKLTRE